MALILSTTKLSADAFISAVINQARDMNQRGEGDNGVELWVEPLRFCKPTWGLHDSVTIEQQDDAWLHRFTVVISHPVQSQRELWDSEDERVQSGYLPIEVRTENTDRAGRNILVTVDYDPSREHIEVLRYAVDLFKKVDALTGDTYDQLRSQSEAIRRVMLGREAPWELIEGPPAHKRAVELKWRGMKHEDIAADDTVGMTKESVGNLLNKLRSDYGHEIVPTISDLRNRGKR